MYCLLFGFHYLKKNLEKVIFHRNKLVCLCVAGLYPALISQTFHALSTWGSCRDSSPEWWLTTFDISSVWTSSMRAQNPLLREPSSCSSATPACCAHWERVARWGWLQTLHRWGGTVSDCSQASLRVFVSIDRFSNAKVIHLTEVFVCLLWWVCVSDGNGSCSSV